MLLDQLQQDLTLAMKSRDSMRVGTLRFLISAVKKFQIDSYPPGSKDSLTDNDVMDIIKKQVKTHKESIAVFTKAGRVDLQKKEEDELQILLSYVPEQMTESDIREVVKRVVSQGSQNFGQVMGMVMKELKGKADGAQVKDIVKEEMK